MSADNPDEFCRKVQAWVTQWVEVNRRWERNWLSQNEELRYEDEFRGAPEVISSTLTELKIRLEGQPSSKWWKDWLVYRILADLKVAFTEIKGVGHIRDCE